MTNTRVSDDQLPSEKKLSLNYIDENIQKNSPYQPCLENCKAYNTDKQLSAKPEISTNLVLQNIQLSYLERNLNRPVSSLMNERKTTFLLNSNNQQEKSEIAHCANESLKPSITQEASSDCMQQQTISSFDAPQFSKIWKSSFSSNPKYQLRRNINSLLNRITVESFPSVAEQLCVILENVKTEEDFVTIVRLTLEKAFSEPDFSEMYADLCMIMSFRAPQLIQLEKLKTMPNKPPHQTYFCIVLYNTWKEEFESTQKTYKSFNTLDNQLNEDQEALLMKTKVKFKGVCCCFSEYVIRRMVGIRAFNVIVSTMLAQKCPPEYLIEGVCQMLRTVGSFLDEDAVGKILLDNCFGRLQELQLTGQLSKRSECLVQDLIDIRIVNWHKKIHTVKAKGLAQIEQEVENADSIGGLNFRATYGTVIKLGERSNLINNVQYSSYIKAQEELHSIRVSKLKLV